MGLIKRDFREGLKDKKNTEREKGDQMEGEKLRIQHIIRSLWIKIMYSL